MSTPLSRTFLFAFVCLAVSCSKEDAGNKNSTSGKPGVAFGYHLNGYVAPSQVTFSNKSTNANSYLWDFGDGTTSTAKDPVHVYSGGGMYDIKLIAGNGEGTSTAGITLTIQPPYTSCRVQEIILGDAPFTNTGGQPWDSASGPDFKIKILYRNTAQVLMTTPTATNVTQPQLPLSFPVAPSFLFPAFSQEYDVLLYDDDAPSPDELISGYYFRLSDATTIQYHYPDTMLLYQAGNTLRMNLVLDWGH